jgi:hypothetical protein
MPQRATHSKSPISFAKGSKVDLLGRCGQCQVAKPTFESRRTIDFFLATTLIAPAGGNQAQQAPPGMTGKVAMAGSCWLVICRQGKTAVPQPAPAIERERAAGFSHESTAVRGDRTLSPMKSMVASKSAYVFYGVAQIPIAFRFPG